MSGHKCRSVSPLRIASGGRVHVQFVSWIVAAILLAAAVQTAAAKSTVQVTGKTPTPTAVITYHNDNLRTGWNPNETVLTPAAVREASFGQIGIVPLDEQVDAEPLYVPNVSIPGVGKRNVVYVATENNTVYAIDADAGTVLLSRNFGAPVPLWSLPGQCDNNGKKVGVTATPVIDIARQTLYVITYSFAQQVPVYRIHALALNTLTDSVPAVVVTAAQPLNNNRAYQFNPALTRLRAALLEANGNVYAAFTSFCDMNADMTRGWVLGWRADTLAPLAGQELVDRLATSPNTYFLSTIWMSGFGIAADEAGSLYFVTGNSDLKGTTENAATNLGESVVKLSPDLTKVQSYFTPSGARLGPVALDRGDGDFGAGGVMLLPTQPGSQPRLAVAAGKAGMMYLLNRDSLGGYQAAGPDLALDAHDIGGCWCGESYFQGADGVGRVVSSGAPDMTVWKVKSSPKTALSQESNVEVGSGQAFGFFTAVSSNGTVAGSQVVWAVTRPTDRATSYVKLYAFDPSSIDRFGQSMKLYSAVAGFWPNTGGNPNIVPLVANGRVYVASYKTLAIFGLPQQSGGHVTGRVVFAPPVSGGRDAVDAAETSGHVLYGTVVSATNQTLVLRTRANKRVMADVTIAAAARRAVRVVVGHALMLRGEYDARGMFHAETVLRAKDLPALWDDDR